MKTRTLLLAVAMICGAQYMNAQTENQQSEPQRPTKEEVNKMIATNAARELMLDEATTAKFIPIYENYLKAMDELRGKECDGKQCCAQRPEGRPDGPRPEGRRGGKRGPKPDGKNGPAQDGEQAPDAKPAADAKACPAEGGAKCGPKAMTDAEVEQAVKDRIARLRNEADIQEKYYTELRAVLTPLQTLRVLSFGPREPQGPKAPQGGRR